MQRLLAPNYTSTLQSYSNSTIECLERSDVADDSTALITGSTFANGKLAWLARGSALEVVDTKTGQRSAAWRFGWSLKQKHSVTITSVVAFPMGQTHRLVVGLKDLSGSLPGMVCLFDPSVSRVIKAVVIPYPVTSLESVATGGGADAAPSLLSLQLKLYFGIVAVGTEQGHTYLVDMRLDDDMEKFDEWNPSSIEVSDCHEPNISRHREKAREDDTHVAVELGGEWHKSGKFYFENPDSRNKMYSAGDVFVSSIKYINQASCLVIGYNFGCFVIWDLSSMTIVYASQVDQYEMSSITHLSFQEPENDPRNCCYLWVARGPLTVEDESLEIPTTLTLYQLIFAAREMLPGYGIVYKDLSGCGRRFEHQLTADAHHLADATSVGSRVICCYTLEKETISHDVSKVDEGSTRDLTLMVCVWEAPSHEPLSSPTCHLGIFDINRWYHSQMQPSLRDAMFGSKDSTCPFFAFFSLAEILDAASPDGIVGVYINSNAVARFTSSTEPALEQHYWPASLKFDACCVMETGIVHSQFLGMQRQILANLRQHGVSSLMEAHSYFNMCWAAGLLPKNFDMSKSQDKNFHLEAILSVCLEHGLVAFITSCIDKLGSQIGTSGFSLRLILDWSWTKVVSLKEQLDQLCVPLFDGGGGTPDNHMLLLLDDMAVQLGYLKSIFHSLLNQSESSSQQGLKDLTEKYNVVSILSVYLKLLLWLLRHGILPEQSVDEEITFAQREFVYSNDSFKNYYNKRQSEMHALAGDVIAIGLMIDKIISQFDGLWLSAVGKEHYPPSSLHSLCGLYLLDKVTLDMKHSVMFYFLLDVCSINSDLNDLNITDQFAKAFGMAENLTKLIKAFWFLDHKDFENAMNLLVDESLKAKEIGPWQNNYIIKTLLLQGEFQKALHFVKTVHPTMHTIEDVRLQLSVLLTNGLVTEAFNFQRHHRNPSINADVLMHFFNGCQQNGNISKVMQLPMNKIEEDHFVNFLQHGRFEASKELLLMYYLQRGRYVEGIRLNEDIKQDTMNEQNPKVLERSKVRNAIVDGYIKCLPSIQRKLIFMPEASHLHPTVKEVPCPKPLSTVLHHVKHGRPVSHASLLNSVMEKVAEARPQTTPQKRRSGPFVGTPLTPITKRLLNDSHRMVFANAKKPELVPEETAKSTQPVVTTPTLLDKKRRKQLYSGADALTLLTTPKIIKRPSKHSITNESITVSTTPQSILKVSRVVRRSASPRTSPTTSPPLSRRGLPDKPKPDKEVKLDKDSVDFCPVPATPSRRIRFATEDPSPTSAKPPANTIDGGDFTSDVPMETTASAPEDIKGVSFLEPDDTQNKKLSEGSLRLESSSSIEEDKDEVQITAAVVDLRGSCDIEEEVIGNEEEDYSSYELDESDNVIAEDSEEEVMSRRDSIRSSSIGDPPPTDKTVQLDNEDPLMRSSPQTLTSTSSEDLSSKHSKESPHKTPSPKELSQTRKTPHKMMEARIDLTMTPPKSPQTVSIMTNSTKTPSQETQGVEDYEFSPPAILRTPGPSEYTSNATATDNFLFSPPLTRSMIKRRSLDVSKSSSKADVSITGRSLRPRSQSGRYTPHQSPTDSPISFVSPAPSQPKSPKGSRQKSAKKPVPKHKMTLRSRLTLRSAKLPP